MFKKFSNTSLIIILFVLVGLVALNKFYFSKKSESTFNDEFVNIDTSTITQILLYPRSEKGKEIKISKQANHWELQQDQVKTMADSMGVRNLISNFVEMKSTSLAGMDKSSWKELKIDDTSGTRVKIMTSDNKTYDMVVGKFGYSASSRNGISYIRRADEEAVYAIDGYLSFLVDQPFSRWRNKIFISGNAGNWNMLTFTYPGDSSFVLSKQNNTWTVNGVPADSGTTAQYLNSLSTLQNSSFVDHYSPSSTPLYTLTIQGNNQPAPITIAAYPADSTQKFILHSSLNSDAYFSDGQNNMTEKIFVSNRNFMNTGASVTSR